MYKTILATLICAVMFAVSIPAEASFGQSRSSTASTTRTSSGGGLSKGQSVGMQRQAVTNNVRNPAPASNYNRNYSGNSYRSGYAASPQPQVVHNTTIIHSGGYGSGYGMGSLAVAAMGGYMLNGMLYNHNGGYYTGPGYYNGVPIAGGQYAPVDAQVPMMQPQVVPQQVVYQVQPTNWFNVFMTLLLVAIVIVVLMVVIRRTM
jgi:hypothetical protein